MDNFNINLISVSSLKDLTTEFVVYNLLRDQYDTGIRILHAKGDYTSMPKMDGTRPLIRITDTEVVWGLDHKDVERLVQTLGGSMDTNIQDYSIGDAESDDFVSKLHYIKPHLTGKSHPLDAFNHYVSLANNISPILVEQYKAVPEAIPSVFLEAGTRFVVYLPDDAGDVVGFCAIVDVIHSGDDLLFDTSECIFRDYCNMMSWLYANNTTLEAIFNKGVPVGEFVKTVERICMLLDQDNTNDIDTYNYSWS